VRVDIQVLPERVSATNEMTGPPPAAHEPFATQDAAGAITVPAEDIAVGLGVPVEIFLAGLRAGIVYQTAELGLDSDAGRRRLTFRFRHRQFQVIVDENGYIVHASPHAG
jgi:hypothetical protein